LFINISLNSFPTASITCLGGILGLNFGDARGDITNFLSLLSFNFV